MSSKIRLAVPLLWRFCWAAGAQQNPPAAAAAGIVTTAAMVGAYGNDYYFDGFVVQHGFLLSGGTFTSFDVPFAGVAVTLPVRINNSGQAVGLYLDTNATYFGFNATIGP